MKKLFLIITLIAFTTAVFAQAKTDTAKKTATKPHVVKPEYKLDPNQVYTINLHLTAVQIYALTGTSAGSIHRSAQLTGEQIGNLEDEAKALTTAINAQANRQADSIYKKWKADTTATANKLLKVKSKNK